MSFQINQVDKGASVPLYFVDVSGNSITAIRQKIAEFGLQVDEPNEISGSFNFVDLNGTIGVTNADVTLSTVRIILTRRNTLLLGAPEIDIFSTDQNTTAQVLDVLGHNNISFSFTEGGIAGNIPASYYAYSLYIQISPLVIEPLNAPYLSGPISFTGNSYVRNVIV